MRQTKITQAEIHKHCIPVARMFNSAQAAWRHKYDMQGQNVERPTCTTLASSRKATDILSVFDMTIGLIVFIEPLIWYLYICRSWHNNTWLFRYKILRFFFRTWKGFANDVN